MTYSISGIFKPSSPNCFLCRAPGRPGWRSGSAGPTDTQTHSLPPPGCWRCSCSSAAGWWSWTWWGSYSPRWSPTGTHTLRSDPASFTAETGRKIPRNAERHGADPDPRCVQGPAERAEKQLASDRIWCPLTVSHQSDSWWFIPPFSPPLTCCQGTHRKPRDPGKDFQNKSLKSNPLKYCKYSRGISSISSLMF